MGTAACLCGGIRTSGIIVMVLKVDGADIAWPVYRLLQLVYGSLYTAPAHGKAIYI